MRSVVVLIEGAVDGQVVEQLEARCAAEVVCFDLAWQLFLPKSGYDAQGAITLSLAMSLFADAACSTGYYEDKYRRDKDGNRVEVEKHLVELAATHSVAESGSLGIFNIISLQHGHTPSEQLRQEDWFMSFLTLIKRARVFAPKELGIKDVLLGGRQILAIGDDLSIHGVVPEVTVLDADGMYLFPGLIDAHVHMAGGGGEGGFHYRTPEISLTHLTTAGVTTAIGVLGTDGVTRTTRELLAKANGLDFEGISTFIYCGAYQVPTRTITGTPRSDIVLIDKVIGVGEIAIADSRSSHPNEQEIAELCSEAYVGGLLGGKAGVVHFHVGDDESHLELLQAVAKKTRLPLSVFVPTHLNRNPDLLDAAVEWGKMGGLVDVTSGIRPDEHDDVSVKPSKALRKLLDAGVKPSNITMSSDSNGSSPIFDEKGKLVAMGIGNIATLWEETVDAIRHEGVPIDMAVSIVSRHVARVLNLRDKGRVKPNFDADLMLCDDEFKIQHVFCKGRLMVQDAKPIVFGTYEDAHRVPGSPESQPHTGEKDAARGRPMIDPDDDDEEHFPDRDERQQKSRRRRYCC